MKVTKDMIDPQLRAMGAVVRVVNSDFSKRKFRIFHKLLRMRVFKPRSRFFSFRYEWIKRRDGSLLRVSIFQPKQMTSNLPGVLWLHGGGYAMGAPEHSASRAKEFIKTKPCIIIAPAYRLSPKASYPAALEDAYATLVWMKHHALSLGIDDTQLIVGGESAGGGLAMAVSLYARDKKEVNIAFQMPLYPMIDDRNITPSSQNNDAPLWNSTSNQNAWQMYLKDLYQQENTPIYAAPARTKDYKNLPPLITFVGGLEPFKDETNRFVEAMKKEQIPVFLKIYEGAYHGFDRLCPWSNISKEAIGFLLDSFSYALAHYFAKQSS